MENPSFVLNKIKDTKIEDRPVPEIKDPHWVRIKVKETGICGSDIHYLLHGGNAKFVLRAPMVLGHESSGIVDKIGSEVTTLKVGDRVALEPGVPNRYSKEIKAGKYNLDPALKFAASPPVDGTLARYYTLPEDFCYKLPDNVSLDEGALIEPTGVAVHSSKLADIRPGDSVVIFGAGPVGLLTIGVAAAFGALNILAVDINEPRLEIAKEMGATHIYVPQKGDTPLESSEKIIKLLDGVPPRVVIDASGVAPSIQTGVHVLAPSGTFVQVGMGASEVNFPIGALSFKEGIYRGSFRYGPGDYALAIDLISKGKLNVKKLITHKVDFENARDAFDLVISGKAIKVLINGPK